MDLITVNNLSVRRGKSTVLRDVNLKVSGGQWTGLVGPNGSGKTTLLSALGGLLPYSGEILLNGRELSDLGPREIANSIAVVRQSSPLLFDFSVQELVLLGLSPSRSMLAPFVSADYKRVSAALESVDLSGFDDRSVLELSGGERQRVFLAQALLQDPSLLLLDEPTNHLDVHHTFTFLNRVRERVAGGLSVVSAFHDLDLAARYVDSVCVVSEGTIAVTGSPEMILTPELVKSIFRMNATTTIQADGQLSIHFISPT